MPLFRNLGQLVAAYNAAPRFLAEDFLFDANVISSMYQDPFQTTVVLASGDTIGYIEDNLTN